MSIHCIYVDSGAPSVHDIIGIMYCVRMYVDSGAILCIIPYAYKFSQDFIFANFANQQVFAKMKTRKIVCIRYKFAAAGCHSQN